MLKDLEYLLDMILSFVIQVIKRTGNRGELWAVT